MGRGKKQVGRACRARLGWAILTFSSSAQWGKKAKDADVGADSRAKPGGNSGVWADYDKQNALFEEYYRAQGIMDESEWPAFLEALQRDLPTTFRVTGSRA